MIVGVSLEEIDMKKPLIALVVASVAVVSVGRLRHANEREPASRNVLIDRLWIDRVPQRDTDTVQVFAMLSEQPVGVFSAASQWRGSHELFVFEASGSEVRVTYPQTREREKLTAKAQRCDDAPDREMDFCLVLDGASRGVKHYYSREGWEIDRGATIEQVQARIAALVAKH